MISPGERARRARKQAAKDRRRLEASFGPEPSAVACGECEKTARLVGGERIYPHRPDLFAKRFWLCECGAYVGCHLDTAIPLGTPAGPETQRARRAAHAAFDPLWQAKMRQCGMSKKHARGAAYKWLAEQLGIEPKACHIGMFDAATARRVADLCAPYSRAAAR